MKLKLISLELRRIEEKRCNILFLYPPVSCPITSIVEFFFRIPPLDGSDTRGSCGQHTRDDKERIGHDSALCRREATEDHRSRAGEYEWWSGSNRRYSPTERNLQERDGDHTQRPSDSIRPGSLDWFVFRGRLTSAELDFIKGDASFRESCNDTGFIFYR